MNIINKLTIRHLKQNKKRTIFTLFSIILSIIMINCIGISLYSFQTYYKKIIEKDIGSFHYQITTSIPEAIDLVENDNEIKYYYFTKTNYALYEDMDIDVKNCDETYYQKKNTKDLLYKGSLPDSSNEIALMKDYGKNIGDTITLKYEDKAKTYTVVGIIKEHTNKSTFDSEYQAITYIDLTENDYITITIEDKETSSHIFDHAKKLVDKIQENDNDSKVFINYNSSYLAIQNIFEKGSQSSMIQVYKLVFFILMIIIIASVIIIYQSFQLSLNDKIQYLGMLSSVGATPKQKRNSIFFEGLLLTSISIPFSLIISYIGLYITFMFINHLDIIKTTGVELKAVVSLPYTIIVIVLSILTVFISLIIPAIKLSRITIIDALKKNDEVKVKQRKLKTNKFQKKFLSFNNQLAYKNYKRQGRKSKVIIGSLVLSMVLFVSIMSFSRLINLSIDERKGTYDIRCWVGSEEENQELLQYLNNNSLVDNYYYYEAEYGLTADIDNSYLKNDKKINSFRLNILDDESYQKVCDKNKIKNNNQLLVINQSQYSKMDRNFLKNIVISTYNESSDHEITKSLDAIKDIQLINNDLYNLSDNNTINLIISCSEYKNITGIDIDSYNFRTFYIRSSSHQQLNEELENKGFNTYDDSQNKIEEQQMLLVAEIFIYGFVVIMIIFTSLNIINMMNASIDARQKEFGMLLSVGMSYKSIKKMIWNESFIYSKKTLIYGIPLCLIIECVMYVINSDETIPFTPYILAYIIAFISIMIVMLLTFRISLKKINKRNIIETLKDDI